MAALLALVLACAGPRQAALPAADPSPGSTAEGPLRAELVVEGRLEERLRTGDGADLVLLYGAEEGGDLGPCGCEERPRGGLSRIATWRAALEAAEPAVPVLSFDAGGWLSAEASLDGSPRLDIRRRNAWMLRGMGLLQPSALNVAAGELRALSELQAELAGEASPLPLVSAHLRAGPELAVQVEPWRVLQAGALRVGVTGMTAPGPRWMSPEGWIVTEPLEGTRATLQALRPQVDLVVLLAWAAPEAARELAEEGLVDVVIDAWNHRSQSPPFRVGQAVWVRAHHQTMRLGELRLGLAEQGAAEGRIAWAHERKIDLDPSLPAEPALEALREEAELDLRQIERATLGRPLR